MSDVTLYLTGDQIGTYDWESSGGNGNGMKVELNGVKTLGGPTDVFRLVVKQTNGGSEFSNGQFVEIYAYPDEGENPKPIFSQLNPQHDRYQGRASSHDHQIFDSGGQKVVFDVNGLSEGKMTYGPGYEPPRHEKMPFDSCYSDPPDSFPCFAAGTLIDTPDGPRRVETLAIGDLVTTRDNGAQPVLWAGSRRVTGRGKLAPVLIEAGALGNDRALVVSAQHRILLSDARAPLLFDDGEVLVPALALVNGTTIRRISLPEVTYCHIALENHEILTAEGIACESLLLGETGVGSLAPAARAELAAIFPELTKAHPRVPAPARPLLRPWEAEFLREQ
ncbi:Hint domain-containing protein [Tropicimonas sp. IMCC34011]|uniref:Hint domain-containing protein n=1 Tax=Tropicimonas sp. IMCC34011 TaxID=2248759 RepID=UPI000E275E65|nr:Hint domain-containing protein [Tropicimonas sp. IMCC34011]